MVANYADNPSGGSDGNSTELLRALIDAGITNACFGPMADGHTVAELHCSTTEDTVSVRFGGKIDLRVGGGPLDLTGTLMPTSEYQGQFFRLMPTCS